MSLINKLKLEEIKNICERIRNSELQTENQGVKSHAFEALEVGMNAIDKSEIQDNMLFQNYEYWKDDFENRRITYMKNLINRLKVKYGERIIPKPELQIFDYDIMRYLLATDINLLNEDYSYLHFLPDLDSSNNDVKPEDIKISFNYKVQQFKLKIKRKSIFNIFKMLVYRICDKEETKQYNCHGEIEIIEASREACTKNVVRFSERENSTHITYPSEEKIDVAMQLLKNTREWA